MFMVRELLALEEINVEEPPPDSPAMSIGETTPEFLNACCRLLDLLDSPKDIPFLSGLIQREVIYRISARTGRRALVRSCNARRSKPPNRQSPSLDKHELHESAAHRGTGEDCQHGSFDPHHHFRMLTAMSPLQYQKQLRLQSARSLMLNNGLDAASAAFEVGYESASQFNREYSRFFGQPPMRDVRAVLSPDVPKLQLVDSL
jgi:hypothetical protein